MIKEHYDHNEQKKNLEIDLSVFESGQVWEYTGSGYNQTAFRKSEIIDIEDEVLVCKKLKIRGEGYLKDGKFRIDAGGFLYNWYPVKGVDKTKYIEQIGDMEIDDISNRLNIDKYRVTKYLNNYIEYLKNRENEYNEMDIVNDYQINFQFTRIKRRNQIVEAFEDGIDIGGITEHIVNVEGIEIIDGTWVFKCSNGKYYSLGRQLEDEIITNVEKWNKL